MDESQHTDSGDGERDRRSGGEHVYEVLVEAGIDLLVGLPGTQTLPLDRVVADRDEIDYVMAHHETAVPHVAWAYYEVSGTPAATLTVPGPGDTNAMHGLKNALEDCVPIVHVSADIDPEDRGKGPIHEIESDTFDNCVKENVTVERPIELRRGIEEGVQRALTPPMGPVRLGVPSGILSAEVAPPAAEVTAERVRYDNEAAYDRAADALAAAETPVIYAGGGARRSPDGAAVTRELARTLDAPVVTSYKGKGVFPEDDPRFLGVTGSHLPAGARSALGAADAVLALGTDFDGVTTDHWELPLGETLVHVTLDTDDVNRSYDADVAIVDDVTRAGNALLERLDGRDAADGWSGREVGAAVREEYDERLAGLQTDGGPVRTPTLLRELRAALPRETVVTTDIGGFRLWTMQAFETYAPDRMVTGGSWAGMGIGLPAAIGAKLARPDAPVAAFTGDGGLLMCLHELHTAAQYDLDIVVVVSNNGDYGIISKSPAIKRYTDDHRFTWDEPSFADVAEEFGWHGRSVATADEVGPAVEDALAVDGPALVDVDVETEEPSASAAAEYETSLTFR